jgi:hypothetical protein
MNDRFAPLGDDEAAQKTHPGDEWTPVVPVHDDAPKAFAAIDEFAKFKGMSRTGLWQYTNAEGRLLALTARFDHPPNGEPGEKEFRQFTFCENASGRREWRNKSLPLPRPLFGLARLAKAPAAPGLLVEGEKTAADMLPRPCCSHQLAWREECQDCRLVTACRTRRHHLAGPRHARERLRSGRCRFSQQMRSAICTDRDGSTGFPGRLGFGG